jgi:hypothetical protein
MMNMERGLILALLIFLVGVVLLALVVNKWRLTGFGNLGYSETMRRVVPAATLTALSAQATFSSFFVSTLGVSWR